MSADSSFDTLRRGGGDSRVDDLIDDLNYRVIFGVEGDGHWGAKAEVSKQSLRHGTRVRCQK
jgi:hypothetical protein